MASKSDQLGSDVAVIAIGTRASRQEWVARGRSNAFVMMKSPKEGLESSIICLSALKLPGKKRAKSAIFVGEGARPSFIFPEEKAKKSLFLHLDISDGQTGLQKVREHNLSSLKKPRGRFLTNFT